MSRRVSLFIFILAACSAVANLAAGFAHTIAAGFAHPDAHAHAFNADVD